MQNPNEDTEWNDVLRSKGILPPKPKEAEITEEQIENMLDNVVQEYTKTGKSHDEMNLDELDELEDELDEKVFLEYRQKRINEMKAQQRSARFGEVLEITAQDYVQEVNKAGENIWVIIHLYKPGVPLCTMINSYLNEIASKYPTTKFIKSISTLCIPNYPDKNLPTIFVYLNGQMKQQFIGPIHFSANLKADVLEWMLSETGAFKTDIEKDPRHKVKDALFSQLSSGDDRKLRESNHSDNSDDDNDW